ncbi:YeaH/YhbH family protein [Parvibium lacunae]|uniref:UPF0229 protein DU000_02560 n=1 Tax=Parvibium lacunae TaxID=1888893 RepID=A0A368L7M7_9BURK|nr:YeaH/YhbH family protein [Parvibium lacunae]RCS59617.1 YeaH/YhbH family protein [Parvibium lacunae]
MFQVIDRRLNGKNKSAINRERFLRRYRTQIKEAVNRSIKGRSITDVTSGEGVSIPVKDIREPNFGHGQGGEWETVHPGNEDYVTGDQIERPQGGGQGKGGGEASEDGEGQDEFAFTLSRDEYLNYIFDDLALPNLVKTHLSQSKETKLVRAGFTNDGSPTNINVVRSMKGAIGRRLALATPLAAKLKALEQELQILKEDPADHAQEIADLEARIHVLRGRILGIPYLDPLDLRYSHRVKQPKPNNKAVMFCLMDVSGSMDEDKKDMAKRFFILLYLFLQRAYEEIEVVFIRHHTQAQEVSEQDFFYSRESGGTVVSSGLKLMVEIMAKRYAPDEWNIYAAQASDGDNWSGDSPLCGQLIHEQIMPLVQYFAYIEITDGEPQNLWFEYEKLKETQRYFSMQRITQRADIFPVFRELFKKQTQQALF